MKSGAQGTVESAFQVQHAKESMLQINNLDMLGRLCASQIGSEYLTSGMYAPVIARYLIKLKEAIIWSSKISH